MTIFSFFIPYFYQDPLHKVLIISIDPSVNFGFFHIGYAYLRFSL